MNDLPGISTSKRTQKPLVITPTGWDSYNIARNDIKIVVVGLHGTGKTCFLIRVASGLYPEEYIPTVFDNYGGLTEIDGNEFPVALWDTAGGERFDRLRPLSYPMTDVFIYAISPHPMSLLEIEEVFEYEVPHYGPPGAPKILCMLGSDRKDGEDSYMMKRNYYSNFLNMSDIKKDKLLTTDEALKFAKKIGVQGYAECSAKFNIGIKEVFEMALRLALKYRREKGEKEKGKTHKISKFFKSFKVPHLSSTVTSRDELRMEVSAAPQMPIAVYGHGCVCSQQSIYIIGGSEAADNVVWKYSIPTNSWSQIASNYPSQLKFQTCTTVNQDVYIFGGKSNGYSNDLYKSNSDDFSHVQKVQTSGSVPSPRYGHSAVYFDEKIFVFGGYDNSGTSCNDLYSFDIGTSTWERILSEGGPKSRNMHTAVVYEQQMFLFGGTDGSKTFGDLYCFDFGTSVWKKLKPKGKAVPSYGHSATDVGRYMIIIGGCDKSPRNTAYHNEARAFDFSKCAWIGPTFNTEISPRIYHSSVCTSPTSLLIIGGKDSTGTNLQDTISLSHQSNYFNTTPDYIMLRICHYLAIPDLLRMQSVCKRFAAVCEAEEIWKSYLEDAVPFMANNQQFAAKNDIPQSSTTSSKNAFLSHRNADHMLLSIPPSYPPSTAHPLQ